MQGDRAKDAYPASRYAGLVKIFVRYNELQLELDASSSGALGRALFQQQLGVASSSGALGGALLSSSTEWRSLERSSAAADNNLRIRSVRKSAPEKSYVESPKGFP